MGCFPMHGWDFRNCHTSIKLREILQRADRGVSFKNGLPHNKGWEMKTGNPPLSTPTPPPKKLGVFWKSTDVISQRRAHPQKGNTSNTVT